MGKILLRLSTTLAFFAIALPMGAATIINGSFETATPGNHVPAAGEDEILAPGSTAMTGWTVLGPSNISWLQSGFSGIPAEDGNSFLDLTGPGFGPTQGGVQQTVTLAAGNYALTFFLGSLDNSEPDSVLVSAGNQSNVLFTNSDTGTGSHWNLETLNFHIFADGPVTISIQGDPTHTLSSSPYVGLDNVNLLVLPTPEPAAIVLTLFGIVALIGFRYFRSRLATFAR